jgi:hypothetical protein
LAILQQQIQQQQAALLLAQRQNALLLGLPHQQPPQNAMLMAAPQPNAAAAQPRPQPAPERNDPPQQPEAPGATAARKLRLARELAADAETARREGEPGRAARMRERAVERFRDVIARYPGTLAADQAKEVLDTMDP